MAGDHGVAAEGVEQVSARGDAADGLGVCRRHGGDQRPGPAGRRPRGGRRHGRCRRPELAGRRGEDHREEGRPRHGEHRQGAGDDPPQAVQAIDAGIEVVAALADSTDVFGTGDMGIANTTPSTAVVAAITGEPVAALAGRGTGIDDAQLTRKIAAVEAALAVNRPDARDGLDVLAKVGGFEIGGIAGVVLAAAARRKPVVVDGFISTAGALIAQALCPAAIEYVVAAHRSAEQGHRAMQRQLGKEPLLDLNLRLGEGSGAALAMNLVEAAQRILTEVATFDEAHVSQANA